VQTDISGSPWDHAMYRYNGLGYRIQWQYDENINFTLSSSERFYFLYDDRWRIVATFRDTDSSAKESFVYHAAGVAGRGGSSYIDSVILRDKDANTGWTSSGDGTLEDRVFYSQNWRADVVAITKDNGQPVEFIRYTSYGVAQAFAAADVNRDGTVNSTDAADWDNLYSESPSGAAIPVDFDFDGSSFNPDDNDAFTAAYNEASGWTNGGLGAGGGKLSRIGNRKGYAGYEYDPAIVAYHVRHRVYLPEIGRWTKRDPLGYVDGMSVYEYVGSMIVRSTDSTGLSACTACQTVVAAVIGVGCSAGAMATCAAATPAGGVPGLACAALVGLVCILGNNATPLGVCTSLGLCKQGPGGPVQQPGPSPDPAPQPLPKIRPIPPALDPSEPHFVTSCAAQSLSYSQCTSCCLDATRNTYRDACEGNYDAATAMCTSSGAPGSCARVRCLNDAISAFNACDNTAVGYYNACIANCDRRLVEPSGTPPIPLVPIFRPLIPLPPGCLATD
jgi:RHS repeat-associated protein